MTIELLKQLREAGFPQFDDGRDFDGRHILDDADEGKPLIYQPTLSELIEACGDDFLNLEKNLGVWYARGGADPNGRRGLYSDTGTTPEIAVARLWLLLAHTK